MFTLSDPGRSDVRSPINFPVVSLENLPLWQHVMETFSCGDVGM